MISAARGSKMNLRKIMVMVLFEDGQRIYPAKVKVNQVCRKSTQPYCMIPMIRSAMARKSTIPISNNRSLFSFDVMVLINTILEKK
jgi:membrane peptidoglycan carboxypeptidase